MHITITCGPSYEPVDQVRRITNFSTGELGVLLASSLSAAGHRVTCFKGEGATYQNPGIGIGHQAFTTNEDLVAKLATHVRNSPCDLFFHAAGLNDFRVKSLKDENGNELKRGKVPSSSRDLTLLLEPAVKVISFIPKLFPQAKIVAWKYEVEGSKEDALEKGRQQMTTLGTLASVVNGPAWGSGFGVIQKDQPVFEAATKKDLCEYLSKWVAKLA